VAPLQVIHLPPVQTKALPEPLRLFERSAHKYQRTVQTVDLLFRWGKRIHPFFTSCKADLVFPDGLQKSNAKNQQA
jgi:hypothetical protein